jgi:hypothetical protein
MSRKLNFEYKVQDDTIIIDLKNNSINDEYGREITGIAIGTCNTCGSEYRRLIIRGEDGIPSWSAWCGDCDIVNDKNNRKNEEDDN